MIADLKILETKQGKKYANFKATDSTGSIPAVWWDFGTARPQAQALFKEGGLVELAVSIESYKDKPQLVVSDAGPATITDMYHFEKSSKYNPQSMWNSFMSFATSFENKWFRDVATLLAIEHREQFMSKPAATDMHHAFKHGLLEHTLQMLETGAHLLRLPFYAEVLNKDLCMFGLMFHDFGKIFEYGDGPAFKKTLSGIKVPHIPKMAAVIYHTAATLEIPDALKDEMMSIVLSHHRFMEWGSPCTPSSPEALFVHFIDNLHGEVFGVLQKIENDVSSEDRVKFGFGMTAYVVPKKRFSTLLKELETEHELRPQGTSKDFEPATGSQDSMGGF